MKLTMLLILAGLSTLGFTPASPRGQFLDVPQNFHAHANGNDIVVRWSAAEDAELYIGEIDSDPDFDSPKRWVVRDDGRWAYEHRIHDLGDGTYYLRVRSAVSFLIIERRSDWTHVERVTIGRGRDADDLRSRDVLHGPVKQGDARDLRDVLHGPVNERDVWDDDEWEFPASREFPRRLGARASGDEILLAWSPVVGADVYLIQVDRDLRFRHPFTFDARARDDRGAEEFRIRNVPAGRWYARVAAVKSVVARDIRRWSEVAVVEVGVNNRLFRREADLREGRTGVVLGNVRGTREHPVFDEHPGRGKGKGHLKHEGKRRTPGHARDRDRRDDEGEDD
jgi:hypothetical protein